MPPKLQPQRRRRINDLVVTICHMFIKRRWCHCIARQRNQGLVTSEYPSYDNNKFNQKALAFESMPPRLVLIQFCTVATTC